MTPNKIPVILDTDIGDDIDDTWALGFLLRCHELDLKRVSVNSNNTVYKAKLVAKFLEGANRTDIPVALGPVHNQDGKNQMKWVKDYDLDGYPGEVFHNGIEKMIEMILSSPEPITLVPIGPLSNIAEAIDEEPKILQNCRMVGMQGSVYVGYGEGRPPVAEYNVVKDRVAAQMVFDAVWLEPIVITPLDTCGNIILDGDRYKRLLKSEDPLVKMILENYKMWSKSLRRRDFKKRSSILFDTVAVYLAFTEEWLEMETLGIRVDSKGVTVIDPDAQPVRVATKWKNLPAFYDMLVERLSA